MKEKERREEEGGRGVDWKKCRKRHLDFTRIVVEVSEVLRKNGGDMLGGGGGHAITAEIVGLQLFLLGSLDIKYTSRHV